MNLKNVNMIRTISLVGGVCVVAVSVALAQQQFWVPGTSPGVAQADALSMTFRDVAKAVLPAVVSIEAQAKAMKISLPGGRAPFQDEFFKRFFGDDFDFGKQFRQRGIPQMPSRRGGGSGFISDSSGIILTNAHVLKGADRVTVKLEDGRELRATEWHADEWSDVAIVRVDVDEPLPYVPLGDSDQMEIGDWVLALGNPFDVGTTVTSGVISAKGRNTGINARESYLQTDAAINPGNSGGPLVNLRGEVVGINTAISTRSGGYDGVGFAIPVNDARWVVDQLIANDAVKRPYLGVQLKEMTSELRTQFNIPNGHGAVVVKVYDDSPAAHAGIESLDVILNVAGQQVKHNAHLQNIVEKLEIGRTYLVIVSRNGEEMELDITFQEMPSEFFRSASPLSRFDVGGSDETSEYNEMRLEITSTDNKTASELGIADDAESVLITAVEPNSPAARARLRAGDVIEKVGSHRVTSPEEFEKAANSASLDVEPELPNCCPAGEALLQYKRRKHRSTS